jgi:hypothetical protein
MESIVWLLSGSRWVWVTILVIGGIAVAVRVFGW